MPKRFGRTAGGSDSYNTLGIEHVALPTLRSAEPAIEPVRTLPSVSDLAVQARPRVTVIARS